MKLDAGNNGKVLIRIVPSVASILGKERLNMPNSPGVAASESEGVVIERDISGGTTIGTLFAGLAASYADFLKAVYDPASGKVSDQVMLVLNGNLLSYPQTEVELQPGDNILLLPVYAGG